MKGIQKAAIIRHKEEEAETGAEVEEEEGEGEGEEGGEDMVSYVSLFLVWLTILLYFLSVSNIYIFLVFHLD